MRPRNALLLAIALGGTLVLLELASRARPFDATGTWVVDAAATNAARGDAASEDTVGTLTLDVRGTFVLEIVDSGAHLAPKSGIWFAERDGFTIEGGTWRGSRGRPHAARLRDDGAVVIELAGKPLVLRRADHRT